MSDSDDPVRAFAELPRRVFLDSNVLQAIRRWGGFLFENEPVDADARTVEDLEALRDILLVNERAHFEFVLSENSLAEALDKDDPGHTQWAYDVLDTWQIQLAEYPDPATLGGKPEAAVLLDGRQFGRISAMDKLLLQDALTLGCDAFLTLEGERKLPANADQVRSVTGLRILRPPEYWALLRPWAALF